MCALLPPQTLSTESCSWDEIKISLFPALCARSGRERESAGKNLPLVTGSDKKIRESKRKAAEKAVIKAL